MTKKYEFRCIVCNKPSKLFQLAETDIAYVFGVAICDCKGIPPKPVSIPNNVIFLKEYKKNV